MQKSMARTLAAAAGTERELRFRLFSQVKKSEPGMLYAESISTAVPVGLSA
jgi:hypothetical protein